MNGIEPVSDRPLVSIILIFLNAGEFIRAAVDSVLAQTYPHWELLLVDDGSTDRSTAIAGEYAERDPARVRCLSHPGRQNRGKSAARNLGLRAARGELIAFLDADDVYLPDKLEQQIALLAGQPQAGMVYGRTLLWHSWTGKPEDQERDRLTPAAPRLDALYAPPDLLTAHLQNEDYYACTCSVLIRSEVVRSAGEFEEDFRDLNEDLVFFSKIFLQAPVYVDSRCWDRYRRHPGSSWSVAYAAGQYFRDRPYPARQAYYDWLDGHLRRSGLKNTRVWWLLQRERALYRHPALYRLSRGRDGLPRRASGFLGQAVRPFAALVSRKPRPPAIRFQKVRFGSLRRLAPFSYHFGYDRGLPVDRYYIEAFLAGHAGDIRGSTLEIGDRNYTRQFGGERVTRSEVLHAQPGSPEATLVFDLARTESVPAEAFDCILFTQTLQFIYDVPAAVRSLYRMLKPGGVLLATFPGISHFGQGEWSHSWYWSFTTRSARQLFSEVFPAGQVQVHAYGNVLAAAAFLYGLAAGELEPAELDHSDPHYELLVALRAVRPG